MFVVDDKSIQVMDDLSLGEISEFCWHFSAKLQSLPAKGVLALCELSNEITRLLVLGAWHAGWTVALLPEHFCTKQKASALKLSGASILITQDESFDVIEVDLMMTLNANAPEHSFDLWLGVPTAQASVEGYSWSNTETALVLFSSGSTGEPKGICHSVRNMLISAHRFIKHFSINKHDLLLNCAEIHTMSGFRGSVMLPLLSACQLYDAPFQRSLSNVLTALEDSRATIAIVGPNLIRQMALIADKLAYLSQHLKAILSTGARLNLEDKQKLFGQAQIPVFDYYGLTETGGIVLGQTAHMTDEVTDALGKPCDGVMLKVITTDGYEHDQGIGELRIYADGLFLAYAGHQTELRSYFDTGDRVKIDSSGQVYWLHRIKNGYKATSTEWVYPDMVERWLKQHTSVTDATVNPILDATGRLRFHVYVAGITSAEFECWCKDTCGKLLAALGPDYNLLDWTLENNIARSALGKVTSKSQ